MTFHVGQRFAGDAKSPFNPVSGGAVGLLVASFVATIAIGCAGTGSWERLGGIPPRDVVQSPRAAVQSAKPVPLERGQRTPLKLTHSDRVVRIGATRSYFKVVSLSVDSPRTVRIQVTSMCDCFGFNKYLVVPLIEMFDSNGQDVALPSPDVESEQADMSNPLRLVATWMFPVPAAGTYRILVAADNARAGSTVATASGSNVSLGLLPALVRIGVKAAPVGDLSFVASH